MTRKDQTPTPEKRQTDEPRTRPEPSDPPDKATETNETTPATGRSRATGRYSDIGPNKMRKPMHTPSPIVRQKNGSKRRSEIPEKILDLLGKIPGMTCRELATIIGSSETNIARHLSLLGNHGLVVREKSGAHNHSFLSTHTALHIRLAPHLRNPIRYRITRVFIKRPFKTRNILQLAEAAGTTSETTKIYLMFLKARGLASVEKRNDCWHASPNERLVKVWKEYHESEYYVPPTGDGIKPGRQQGSQNGDGRRLPVEDITFN